MDCYIEGIIDTLEIVISGNGTLSFSLHPSPSFLQTVGGDTKKALFIASGSTASGLLLSVSKNEKGKEVIWFSLSGDDASVKSLLLMVKNNRNTIRVMTELTKSQSTKQNSATNPVSANIVQVL